LPFPFKPRELEQFLGQRRAVGLVEIVDQQHRVHWREDQHRTGILDEVAPMLLAPDSLAVVPPPPEP
jgi:hypothetical protein